MEGQERPAAERRRGAVRRTTSETDVEVSLDADGTGRAGVATGIGFFDHVLTAFARHGLFDLELAVRGDLHVDGHHTVEDAGIGLGQALDRLLGDRAGIRRFGTAFAPMDEALVMASIDISGRPFLAWGMDLPPGMIGAFDPVLAEEFFRAFATNARITLHLRQLAGSNGHHLVEAAFKAVGMALRQACELDPRRSGQIPSTKGTIV